MTYELAKQLKDVGFPQTHEYGMVVFDAIKKYSFTIVNSDDYDFTGRPPFVDNNSSGLEERYIKIPTLSELIEACGDRFTSLQLEDGTWYTDGITGDILDHEKKGETPEEAVAKLYIKLNK